MNAIQVSFKLSDEGIRQLTHTHHLTQNKIIDKIEYITCHCILNLKT